MVLKASARGVCLFLVSSVFVSLTCHVNLVLNILAYSWIGEMMKGQSQRADLMKPQPDSVISSTSHDCDNMIIIMASGLVHNSKSGNMT